MTRVTPLIPAALAALAIAAPVATAAPGDASIRPQTGTAVGSQTPSACPPDTRAVQGPAGTGCTTSPSPDSDELGVFGVILAGAGAFAVAFGAGAAAAGGRVRTSTAPAFSEHSA